MLATPARNHGSITAGLLCLLCLTFLFQVPAFATAEEAIRLNNEGVKALNERKCELAIDRFKAAMKIDKNYIVAKKNLGVTHIYLCLNWAQTRPLDALKQAHEARYLDLSSEKARATLEWMIRQLGKDPNLFSDRALLGLQAKSADDFESAIVEFRDALELRDDKDISKKLEEVYRQFPEGRLSTVEELRPKKPQTPGPQTVHEAEQSADWTTGYMRDLSGRIKRFWHPPSLLVSNRTVVRFAISPQGELKNLRIQTPPESTETGQAALKAVQDAAPFKALPPEEKNPMDIEFTFDYNAFRGHSATDNQIAAQKTLSALTIREFESYKNSQLAKKHRSPQSQELPQKTGIELLFDYLPVVQDTLPQLPPKSSALCNDNMINELRILIPARAF